jgi:hypothetical protein
MYKFLVTYPPTGECYSVTSQYKRRKRALLDIQQKVWSILGWESWIIEITEE